MPEKLNSAKAGGFHYRSELHRGEPNLENWLEIRQTLITARDERAMKRVTMSFGDQKIVMSISQAIEIYEKLIRSAGADLSGGQNDKPKT